jgi:hypothetical protein
MRLHKALILLLPTQVGCGPVKPHPESDATGNATPPPTGWGTVAERLRMGTKTHLSHLIYWHGRTKQS